MSDQCQCYQVGGPFIAEDPDCPVHGTDGLASQLAQAQQRIAELEAEKAEQLSTLIDNPITCRNGRQHPVYDGCLYCKLADLEAELERCRASQAGEWYP
jgi:hypothetical protein